MSLEESRVDALFRRDARGRLLEINQWSGGVAPRFFLMRTPAGPIRRYRHDLPPSVVDALETLSRDKRSAEPLPARRAEYLRLMPAPLERVSAGPAFVLPDDLAGGDGCVAIDETNATLLEGGFDDWLADVPHRRPFVAALEDGRAVALCASVRISAEVHCAGVETLWGHRRRGHGERAVRAWAAAVRALGAAACYSTSWGNHASRALAARLGARLIGMDFHLT